MDRSPWIRLCLWTGPVLCAMFAIAMVPLTGFIPPPSPEASAQEIARMFSDDADSIRIGLAIGISAMALIAPFGIGVASMLRGSESGTPVLTYLQIACVAIGTSVAVIMCLVWGTAAFRPDELAPDTTRMLNDLAWFFFLFSFAPFSVWLVAVGLAIITDQRPLGAVPALGRLPQLLACTPVRTRGPDDLLQARRVLVQRSGRLLGSDPLLLRMGDDHDRAWAASAGALGR